MNLIPPKGYTVSDLFKTVGAWALLLMAVPVITYACLVAAILYAVAPAAWTGDEP